MGELCCFSNVNYDRYCVGKEYKNPILWFTFAEFEMGPRKVWGESIPHFVIIDKKGTVNALDFGQPGIAELKKTIKKALKN